MASNVNTKDAHSFLSSSSLVTTFASTGIVYSVDLAEYIPNGTGEQEDTSEIYVGSTSATGAAATITFANSAGVYEGKSSQSWAPGSDSSGTGGVSYDYFATGGTSSSTVTFTFTTSQYYFGFYWGSLSSGNTVTFTLSDGSTVTESYSSLEKTYSSQSSNYFGINITSGAGITKVVFSGADFEFSNVTYSTSTVTFGSGSSALSVSAYDSQGNDLSIASTGGETNCFLAGTRIATPAGEVAVETLKAGDQVLTASGETRPVRWIGRTTVSSRFADPMQSFPIRIAAGAIDENIPARDLLVSPGHALLIDGVLVNAAALVNGLTVTRETAMAPNFVYYHVELDTHDVLIAEGTPAESFVDNASRMAFDNWETHPDDAPVAEMDLPRALSARQVPASIRARLAARIRVETAA